MLAEVVATALHVAGLQRAEQRFEEGDVLEVELLLKVFSASRKDDTLPPLTRQPQRRQQVRQRFAGAGAGLDDQVALLGEGALDGAGHFKLAFTMFKGERRA